MHQRHPAASNFGSATAHKVVAYPGTSKQKRKRRFRVTPLARRLLVYILGSVITVWILRRILVPSSVRHHHRPRVDARVANHIKHYEAVYRGSKTTDGVDVQRKFQNLGPTYGANITSCDLTVLFMDARIGDPSYSSSGPAWFALESLAAYAPKDDSTCVLLLTHSCAMQKHMQSATKDEVTVYGAQEAVRDNIYSKSLPLFRELVHHGRVRVSFLDVDKYNLKSCEDFGDPTPAFLHIDFWRNEFLNHMDSEVVLVLQDDVVLCQDLDIWIGEKYAYAGGLWPKEANDLYPRPAEGMCQGMPAYWESWLAPQRKWELTKEAGLKPDEILKKDFPPICENGEGPVGTGGFSIRQRSWMQTAISTCPHSKYSGLKLVAESLACEVSDEVNEDVYFSVVLRGLGAPLPTAVEASLFSAETLFVEDAVEMYGVRDGMDVDKLEHNSKTVLVNGKSLTLPVGMHKPRSYLPPSLLIDLSKPCPYLKYVYNPQDVHASDLQLQTKHKKKASSRIGSP
jgi:hypothetical protein